MLGPAADLGSDVDLAELLAKDADALVDEALPRPAAIGEHVDELPELVRLEVLEGEVLELPLDLPHAEPMRERRVDLHRLARDAGLLVRRQVGERPHVVEPVGELDDHDADVLGHREEHLSNALGLLLLDAAGAPELGELRDPVHELADLAAEALLEVRDGDVGVLRHVVQERGGQRLGVHLQRGEVVGDLHRMADIRFTRCAHLPLVRGRGRLVRAPDQALVDVRPMALRLDHDVVDRVTALGGAFATAGDALDDCCREACQLRHECSMLAPGPLDTDPTEVLRL